MGTCRHRDLSEKPSCHEQTSKHGRRGVRRGEKTSLRGRTLALTVEELMRVAILLMNFFHEGRRNTRRGGFSPGSCFWFWSAGCCCCCCWFWFWLRPNGLRGSVSVRRSLVSPGMFEGGALFGGWRASAESVESPSKDCMLTLSRRSASRCIRMPRTAGRGRQGGEATRRKGRTLRPPTPAGARSTLQCVTRAATLHRSVHFH